MGININFAPCLDVLTDTTCDAIGDRALGTTPQEVSALGVAILQGLWKSGVIPCAKHFPGHGHVPVDSHHTLPISAKTKEELLQEDLLPFVRAFRGKLPLCMTTHILFEQIDKMRPATLSQKVLSLARTSLKYKGLLVSDDMQMKALSEYGSPEDLAVQALQAGCQILLYCHELEAPQRAFEAIERAVCDHELPPELLERNYKSIVQLKKSRLSLPPSWEEVSHRIGSPAHQELAEKIRRGPLSAAQTF